MKSYVLGHTDRERDRLDLQGRLYRNATVRAFVDSGIEAGMRVMDVGCGSGDVTRLLAEFVSQRGSVHGVDRDAATIADAERRAARSGVTNIAFSVGEIGGRIGSDTFDAVVGRFVLMHQPNPAESLANVAQLLRPGGIVLFLESHMVSLLEGIHSYPWSDVYDELVRWKCRVVRESGADTAAGFRLRQIFRQAGLPGPSMRVEAPLVGGAEHDYYRYMEESVRSMLPQARSLGIDDIDEARVDRIAYDLREEVVRNDGVLVAWPLVAAWGRTPITT